MKPGSTQRLGAAALAFIGCAGAAPGGSATAEAPASASLAPLWAVHIDEVRPEKAAEFERLAIAENRSLHAILREHGQPIAPVFEIVTTGGVYMSLRPKGSLAELDAPSAVPEDIRKLLKAVTDPLDATIHAALNYHHNEIWRFRKAESYIPETPGSRLPAPGYIQLVSERVIPGMEDRYGALVDALGSGTFDATARRDYTDLPDSVPWPGLVPP